MRAGDIAALIGMKDVTTGDTLCSICLLYTSRMCIRDRAEGGPALKKGTEITDDYLDGLERGQWFKLRMADDALNEQLEKAQAYISDRRQLLDDKFEDKKRKLQQGDDLAPGVLKIVKVYLCLLYTSRCV